MSGVEVLYVTCPSAALADELAAMLVASRLAACVNKLAAIHSVYEWQGEVEQATEYPLLIKTTTAMASAAMEAIAHAHPHACPCILRWPVSGGYAPFLAWVTAQTGTVA